jgi:hypothetical protein
MCRTGFVFFFAILLFSVDASAQRSFIAPADSTAKAVSLRVLPQNFYTRHLSFFCKGERQVEKLTNVPIFFRLGTKEYVDYLEKKPNAGWLPK